MLSAGSVQAVLGGTFNPTPFFSFDAAMKKAGATMKATEAQMAASNTRLAASSQRSSAASAAAVGKMGSAAKVSLIGMAVAVAAVGVKSVAVAADFEQAMSRLKASLPGNPSVKTMERFKKAAMEAGAATKFSALDAVQAQTALAKGGLSTANIMGGGLKAALSLAAAGEMELTDAAETTVNAMKQFGIHGSQAGHVADVLATAAKSTTVDVSDMALALRQGGGIAAATGASLDETVAGLSALADASVKGADAGTALKSFFLNIATPSKQAREAMTELGLSIFDSKGELKSMPAIAENLRSSMGKLTREQFINRAGVIAGSDAARTLFAIYKAGPDGMRDYLKAQREVGTAEAMAATNQDNLKGKLENLKGSLETLGISIGTALLPTLTDGAEKLTTFVNGMQTGQGPGGTFVDVLQGVVEGVRLVGDAAGLAGDALGTAWQEGKSGLDTLLGVLTTVVDGVVLMGRAIDLIPGFDVDTGALEEINADLNRFREGLREPTEIKVSANVGAAVEAIKSIDSQKIRDKVARILGKDISAAAKVKQITALGIPQKVARIIAAGVPQTLGEIAAVRGALGALPSSKTVTLTTINRVINQGSKVGPRPPVKLGNKAVGRGAGQAETALVGEGRGGELVGNADGWAWVDQPTVMGLGPGDYVIPTDPQYAGRALGFLFEMLGVPGYAKGRKAKGKAKGKGSAPRKALPIPAEVTFGAVPEDQLGNERDQARERYQKRKDRVHDLDVDIREQRKRVSEAKGDDAKRKARRKLADLREDRKKYHAGGDGLASLSALRKHWQQLSAQFKVLHATNMEIERLNTRQQTERAKMETASKTGDERAWGAARGRRGDLLGTLRAMYARALSLAKPGTTFAAELESKLAGVQGDIADAAGEKFEAEETPAQIAAREAADRLADTGMTDAERQRLAEIEARGSLASLTADLSDDQAAAAEKAGFLENILQAVQADPARGGAGAVRDIADQLRQARDNVASFSTGGRAVNESADLQAQIEQQRTRAETAERAAQINARALGVFQGAGDIGQARIVINQTNQMLTPSDPQVLTSVASAAVGGMALQPARISPRTSLGL